MLRMQPLNSQRHADTAARRATSRRYGCRHARATAHAAKRLPRYVPDAVMRHRRRLKRYSTCAPPHVLRLHGADAQRSDARPAGARCCTHVVLRTTQNAAAVCFRRAAVRACLLYAPPCCFSRQYKPQAFTPLWQAASFEPAMSRVYGICRRCKSAADTTPHTGAAMAVCRSMSRSRETAINMNKNRQCERTKIRAPRSATSNRRHARCRHAPPSRHLLKILSGAAKAEAGQDMARLALPRYYATRSHVRRRR